MIYEVNENLLEFPLDGFIHQCNCFHTMGGGIAARIKEKYPEAYEADVKHSPRGDERKLGHFSLCRTKDGKQIYNLYGQYNYGYGKRYTNYEAVYTGLTAIKEHAIANNIRRLGLPKNMGCRLAGGNWKIIEAMIDEIFECEEIDLYICNYDK